MSPAHLVLHLRLPFSLFLLPVAFLGLLAARPLEVWPTLWILLSLHVFLYPASNAFNSYFDRDEGPIGGLAAPPPVDRSLLVLSLVWETLGLGLAFLAGPLFGVGMVVYGLFSKAYSWDRIRIKARPVVALILITLGQGALTFLCVALAAGTGASLEVLVPGGVSAALLLAGIYPLTQVYQHEEDAKRGEKSFSALLGIRGTFLFSAGAFLAGGGALGVFFSACGVFSSGPRLLLSLSVFLLALLPALGYFLVWGLRVWKDPAAASHTAAMRMNLLASGGINVALALLLFLT